MVIMASRLWGPWGVITVFTLAGGLIGGDIALWPWDTTISTAIPIVSGLLTGMFAGVFTAWFLRQLEELS
jgi:hypothetical protein